MMVSRKFTGPGDAVVGQSTSIDYSFSVRGGARVV
jgi:hypothetical protein